MSLTALKRAAAALAVLVALWLGASLLRGSGTDEIGSLALPQLTAADVDRVLLESASDTFRIERDGTGWTVNGHVALPSGVEELFTALGAASDASELVARSPASHGRMGVDSAGGARLRYYRGDDVLADFWVNKGFGRDGYVRVAGADEVYQVGPEFTRLAGRDLTAWRDRTIAKVAVDSIAAVGIQRGNGGYTLARADSGQWSIDGERADSAAVMRVVGSLRDIQGAGFPTAAQERDSVDFSRPYRTLTVRAAGGDTLLALLFDSTETGAWVRRAEGGPVFRLDRWRVDALLPADSTLRSGGS